MAASINLRSCLKSENADLIQMAEEGTLRHAQNMNQQQWDYFTQ